MKNFAILYINGFAIVILLLTLGNYRGKLKHRKGKDKVFLFLIFTTILALLVDAVLENLWGVPGKPIHMTINVLQTIDFSMTILIPMLWFYYCLHRVYDNSINKILLRFAIPAPAVVYILFMIVFSGKGVIFQLTDSNTYLRGSAFWFTIIISYMYILESIIIILSKRKILNEGELIPYLLVPSVPILLGLLEVVISVPITITLPAITIVLLDIQIYVLNSKTNMDHLTGLNNRMALDSYLKRLMDESHNSKEMIGLIMIDLDEFKLVNDKYGHTEGDRALKAASIVLKESFPHRNFIARYGGDEFTIVINDCTEKLMDQALEALERERKKYNKASSKPYKLSFSLGDYIFNQADITDIHEMFIKVDKLMYDNKNARKLAEKQMLV